MERGNQTEFVTIPAASRRTGLGLRQFHRAIEGGELAVYDVGGWPRLRWDEIQQWLEGKRRPVANQPDTVPPQKFGRRDG